ncbi:unnamed protein product [Ectocarpus sp. CCAP 1310/34]|nr:unnamed protein product [Ectocarpus sp. CCAP 1310/34]
MQMVCAVIIPSEGSLRLDVIDLPTGFFPEGITNGEGWTAFVGSWMSRNIWKGDLETGHGEVFELAAPGPAVGLDHDRQSGYLFVAGGQLGAPPFFIPLA